MTSKVIVALRVPGSPERAFEVFTRDIGLWWRPNPLFHFTPRGPGILAFEPPLDGVPGRLVERLSTGKTFVIGDVRVWERGRRLVFGWRQAAFTPDQNTEVEITFEAVGDETRVTVEHRGWDTVPASHVARHTMPDAVFQMRHAEWWRTLLISFSDTMR